MILLPESCIWYLAGVRSHYMRSHLDYQYWTSAVDCSIGGVPPKHSSDRTRDLAHYITDWPCSWAGCRSGKLGSRRSACRPWEVSSGPPRCWSWKVWRPRLWVLPALVKYQVSVRNISITVNFSNYTVRLQWSHPEWNKIGKNNRNLPSSQHLLDWLLVF